MKTSPEQLTVSTISGLYDSASVGRGVEDITGSGPNTVESLCSGESVLSLGTASSSAKGDEERCASTSLQLAVPLMVAGIGTVGAGVVLGYVQHLEVFQDVKQLFILVPAILGLKGNLDMCLAARLSTQANLGNMSSLRELLKMAVGNVGLVQIQAIVAAMLVSAFAFVAGGLTGSEFSWDHAALLAASSVLTASSSCLVLDIIMIAIVYGSHRMHLNPDNLATPIAASVGDVLSLTLLSCYASLMHAGPWWAPLVVLTFFSFAVPVLTLAVHRNQYASPTLRRGWPPVLGALFISGLGGLVLGAAVNQFDGFVVFQPIINGLGGNLVSVQASRVSTMLYRSSLLGILPPHSPMCIAPWRALVRGTPSARSARLLVLLAVPCQLLFVLAADYLHSSRISAPAAFVAALCGAGVVQAALLLYTAHILVHVMWRLKMDPDSAAIPYLTAIGDLSGSGLLLVTFAALRLVHVEYDPAG